MDLLLDTHTLLWFINGDEMLPAKAKTSIQNINNKCYVSIASIWEIAIKLSLNKLDLNIKFDDISSIMVQNDFELLPISFEHIQRLLKLDFHHKDPFDRIIIAQGIEDKLKIVTKDKEFSKYKVTILWE